MLLVVFPRKTLLEGTAVNISFCPSHTCSHPVRPPSPGRLHCQPPPERLDLKRRTRAWESTWSRATLRHQVEGVSQAEDRPVCEPGPWAAGLAPSGELSRPCSFLGRVLWSQMLYRAHLPVHREQRWAPRRRPDGKAESPSRPPPCDRAGVGEPCTQSRAQPPPPPFISGK